MDHLETDNTEGKEFNSYTDLDYRNNMNWWRPMVDYKVTLPPAPHYFVGVERDFQTELLLRHSRGLLTTVLGRVDIMGDLIVC